MSNEYADWNDYVRTDPAAQEQSAATVKADATEAQYLREARRQMEAYEHRVNLDSFHARDGKRIEEISYKQAMMYAVLATAEAATRQAAVLESLQEFLAEFVGGTNITAALMQWGKEAK